MARAKARNSPERIGVLREGGLHRELKLHYAAIGGLTEQRVGKYVVDVLDGDHIYEIQTANFGALKTKLTKLLETHSVTVVYPIAKTKTIVKEANGKIGQRKSPKRGSATDLFNELVYLPEMLNHPNLDLELAYVSISETRVYDKKRAWRRGNWVISEKKLEELYERELIADTSALFEKFRERLPDEFTSQSVAENLSITRKLAQKFVYCFNRSGVIQVCGKKGNALIYRVT